jgi:hypothetical protein
MDELFCMLNLSPVGVDAMRLKLLTTEDWDCEGIVKIGKGLLDGPESRRDGDAGVDTRFPNTAKALLAGPPEKK